MNNSRLSGGQHRGLKVLSVAMVFVFTASQTGVAVVEEHSEKLDFFTEQALEDFQGKLVEEEQVRQALDSALASQVIGGVQDASGKIAASGKMDAISQAELEELKKKLLNIPEKDLFKFGLDGDYAYTTNNASAPPRQEKGESTWNATANTQIDLSGKKTDVRLEFRVQKHWQLINSTADSYQVEQRLRTRRKWFKKITVSGNSRNSRHNSKTLEIDDNRIRYNLNNQTSINYAFSPKISLNMDLSSQKRLFLQEAFDEDSGWQATMAPSGFWNVTPKSRVSFGYSFGASRNRVESGDTNTHNVRIGYFGQVTKKSSASFDFSINRSLPRSIEGSTSTNINTGFGYAWQVTPKVQLNFQFTRGRSNTTSESVGDPTDDAVVTRTDTFSINDNVSVSLNHRLSQKVTLSTTGGISHSRTKTFVDSLKDSQTRQFTIPFSFNITYIVFSWMRLNTRYNFSFRTGNEKADTSRVHTWTSSMSLNF